MFRRLSVQIYLTIIGSLLLLVLLVAAADRLLPDGVGPRKTLHIFNERVVPELPLAEASVREQAAAIRRINRRYQIDLALYDRRRVKIAAAGRPMPELRPVHRTGSRLRGIGPPAWVVGLPDGRWVVLRPGSPWQGVLRLIALLGGLAIAVSIGAYPVVRRLTGRLERLQAGVEMLGEGELAARVKVEGNDEVARLADSFNRSAERIEALVSEHRLLLANVSHELRTPLARIRVGTEFLKGKFDPERHAALEKDIAELDRLIAEILMSSRLNVLTDAINREEVDLLALAAEEASRYRDCSVSGAVATVTGDPVLLRQLIRNLIENAERHGVPPVEIHVTRSGQNVELIVADRGPGVRQADQDRIFDVFYKGRGSGGTGLGLALVRQIARRHGGDAVWHADPDVKSAIRVWLPATTG